MPISYSDVFNVNKHNFNEIAIQIFHYQATENEIYRSYLSHIGVDPYSIYEYTQIPCIPIGFFKTHRVISGSWEVNTEHCFQSSATTGTETSKHYYHDLNWYKKSFLSGFEKIYGSVGDWCILALLPNYQENEQSSLITMVNTLIEYSEHTQSGFYLNENKALLKQILDNESKGIKTILFGVSFALLDISPQVQGKFKYLTIIETGGMKGRRKEITRAELHTRISSSFIGAKIQSEYGMTELFSQAYMTNGATFNTPPWMHVFLSQLDDPFQSAQVGKNGLINVIDLANIESCSFIATSDIGKMHKDGSFEVLGRFDLSEQRGCNLLIN